MLAALMGGQALGSIASGYFGSQAAGKASAAQSQAATLSSLIQAQQAEQARQDILRGQSQAATALREAQAPTLGALQTSSQQAQDLLRGGTTAASQELQTAREAALLPLFAAQEQQQRALLGGAEGQIGALTRGAGQGARAIQQGTRQGLGALGGAYGQQQAYQQPYLSTGGAAQNQLATLLGVGGAPTGGDFGVQGAPDMIGVQGAPDRFGSYARQPTLAEIQMDPGYEFRRQQGEQALQRSISAGLGGASRGGGALKAMADYSQGLASQEYGNAYNRFMANRAQTMQALQGMGAQGQGAANVMTGAAGNLGTGAASLFGSQGTNLANIYGQQGQNVANVYGALAPNLANIYGTTGQNVSNIQSATGQNLATNESRLRSARIPMFVRVSMVALPKCGNNTTFSSSFSSAVTLGSNSYTSSPAPAIFRALSTAVNAASSTTSPRAVFTRYACSGISASVRAFMW
jgi:hypothetical protein